jgi:hypothetical protein
VSDAGILQIDLGCLGLAVGPTCDHWPRQSEGNDAEQRKQHDTAQNTGNNQEGAVARFFRRRPASSVPGSNSVSIFSKVIACSPLWYSLWILWIIPYEPYLCQNLQVCQWEEGGFAAL